MNFLHTLDKLGNSFELVIVNDGSADETGELADRESSSAERCPCSSSRRQPGLGGGYRTGFLEARGKYLTFFPADRQFPATIIPLFLPDMGQHDLVLGYLPHGSSALLSKVLSWCERLLYAVLFGGMPRFQGILMVRRCIVGTLELKSHGRGWAIIMELIIRAKRRGLTIISIPTEVRLRASGASKVNNLCTILANVRQVLDLRRQL